MADRSAATQVPGRIGRGALLVVVLLIGVACSGGGGGDADALADFEGEPEDFHAVAGESINDPDGLRKRALERLDDDSPARVGAIFALTLTAEAGPALDALADVAGSEDLTERLVAADALAARGESAGLAVLIGALDSDETLGFPDPPQPAWAFAQFALVAYTDQDLGLAAAADLDAAAATKPAWEQWLAENEASLRFDDDEGRFVT